MGKRWKCCELFLTNSREKQSFPASYLTPFVLCTEKPAIESFSPFLAFFVLYLFRCCCCWMEHLRNFFFYVDSCFSLERWFKKRLKLRIQYISVFFPWFFCLYTPWSDLCCIYACMQCIMQLLFYLSVVLFLRWTRVKHWN